MDPNNPVDYDTYDHYDVYFQSDYDRYTRDYEAYEHFVALCEQGARGSSSDPKRRRTYIPRERETAEQRLLEDYFGNDEFEPKYPEENFKRRYLSGAVQHFADVTSLFENGSTVPTALSGASSKSGVMHPHILH
ncbi:hypothetical protein Tco_1293235 [Tanacetum coccineum]